MTPISEKTIWFARYRRRFNIGAKLLPVSATGWLVLAGFIAALFAPVLLGTAVVKASGNPFGLIVPLVLLPIVIAAFLVLVQGHTVPLDKYLELKARKS